MSTATQSTRSEIDGVIESAVGIGTAWIRYGLNVGRTALETSAKTLNESAQLLGELTKKFETPKAE